jgi:integrase
MQTCGVNVWGNLCLLKEQTLPDYIEKRRRKYYAVLDIPKSIQPILGRRRFVQSLKTESISVAERKVPPVILEWKKMIAIARGDSLDGFDTDKLITRVNRVRLETSVMKKAGLSGEEIAEAHEDFALLPNYDKDGNMSYNQELFEATQVVHGGKILLKEHIESYLETTELEPKTVDSRRKSLQRLSSRFKFAQDVKRQDTRYWLNVEIGEGEGRARATLGKLATDCNQYWEYLQLHHSLDLPSPFLKVLPPKNKKKSKAAIKSQRKAFRVEDYHKLLQAAESKRDELLSDLIKLAAHTGCRIEELCGLHLEHVTSDRIVIEEAKTEAGWREVPIHPDIQQTVARLKQTSNGKYLLSGLTFNKYGNRSNAIGKRFGRLKTELGYGPDYVFHSLRRAFSTQLENAGVERTTVARLMGHELADQTFGGYSDGLHFEKLKQAISHISFKGTASLP